MPGVIKPARTLYDKVFNDHIVNEAEDGTILLYIGMLLDPSERCLRHYLDSYD
jgi:hypothetical protein